MEPDEVEDKVDKDGDGRTLMVACCDVSTPSGKRRRHSREDGDSVLLDSAVKEYLTGNGDGDDGDDDEEDADVIGAGQFLGKFFLSISGNHINS